MNVSYRYVDGDPLRATDPEGLDTVVVSGGASWVAGAGGAGSIGIYVSNAPKDIGIVITGEVGTGWNVGVTGSVGYAKGPRDSLVGGSKNVSVSTGPVSGTVSRDAKTGEVTGITVGGGARVGASVTYSRSDIWSFRKWLDRQFDRFLPKGYCTP